MTSTSFTSKTFDVSIEYVPVDEADYLKRIQELLVDRALSIDHRYKPFPAEVKVITSIEPEFYKNYLQNQQANGRVASSLAVNRIFYPEDVGENSVQVYFNSDTQLSKYRLPVRSAELIRRLLDNPDVLEHHTVLGALITALVPDENKEESRVGKKKPNPKFVDQADIDLESYYQNLLVRRVFQNLSR